MKSLITQCMTLLLTLMLWPAHATITATHCTNCDKVLVGAAQFQADSIQWAGSEAADTLFITSRNSAYGFSGNARYQSQAGQNNQWLLHSPISAALITPQANGTAPAMGFFFAPQQSGVVYSRNQYQAFRNTRQVASQVLLIEGEGISDNVNNPALTLDVAVSGDIVRQQACSDVTACDEIQVTPTGEMTFSVTPQLNTANLPADVQTVQYALVELVVEETDTNCTRRALSFSDAGVTDNSFVSGDYFHYLQGDGPEQTPNACIRNYPFLVSIGKTFQFATTNLRSTLEGAVHYTFLIRGHYSRVTPSEYPGSHQTLRLRADVSEPTDPTNPDAGRPTANFIATPAGNFSVELDASTSSDPDGTILSYNWSSNDGTVIPTGQITTAVFPAAGTYTVTLTVVDNDNRTATRQRDITISPAALVAPVANFTIAVNGLTVDLDATAASDADGTVVNYEWQSSDGSAIPSGAITQITYNQANRYQITLTVTDDSGLSDSLVQEVVISSTTPDPTTPDPTPDPVPATDRVETVVGNGTPGFAGDGNLATAAQLSSPEGIVIDALGNLYIADTSNNRIRRVDTQGIISTLAGTGEAGFSGDNFLAVNAQLNAPTQVTVDLAGNLYIADYSNHRIRSVTPQGIIRTVAGNGELGFAGDGGLAIEAALFGPNDVALDSAGNIYIADSGNHRVRRVDTNGIISTVAGNGSFGLSGDGGNAVAAQLFNPFGVAVDNTGGFYIADFVNSRVRYVNNAGIINTVAATPLNGPVDLVLGTLSNTVYIADFFNHRIRALANTGTVTVLAGTGIAGYSGDGGLPEQAQFDSPKGVAVDSQGNVYIADKANHRVRRVLFAENQGDANDCMDDRCSYRVNLTRAGYYVASVTLADGSRQGMWGLSVNTLTGRDLGGFAMGAILRENGTQPGFVGLLLDALEPLVLTVEEYTGAVNEAVLNIERANSDGTRSTVFNETVATNGPAITTGLLSTGFYIASVNSLANSPRGRFGMTVQADAVVGGIDVGGWVDENTGTTGEGFAGFNLAAPQTVEFEVLYGSNYGTVGAGMLDLEVRYFNPAVNAYEVVWRNE